MGWAAKKLEEDKLYKKVKQAMKDPRIVAERKKELEEVFNGFLLISCDYLYRNFGCKSGGIKKYAEFVRQQLEYAAKMPGYYEELNEAFIEEIGVDVLGTTGEGKGK